MQPSTSARNNHPDALAIPINPLLQASLRSLYSGSCGLWDTGLYGTPCFNYEANDGRIQLFYELPASIRNIEYSRIFMNPRLARSGFVAARQYRTNVASLSVETGDVLIILLNAIAKLHDPGRDTAWISLEDIAHQRGVSLRNGSKSRLLDDLRKHVSFIADLRLSMSWRDYKRGTTTLFGARQADYLLDIVDVEHVRCSQSYTSFGVRSGQALAYFLSRDSVRWIGYYPQAILQLSPYHDGFTKKIGAYWTILGSIAGKRGKLPRATPRKILQFCGSLVKERNPGHTIDSFIKAHERLLKIKALQEVSELEPCARAKGYFKNWLDTPISVKLSENLWHVRSSSSVPSVFYTPKPLTGSLSPDQFCKHPYQIKDWRQRQGIHQEELARSVGISRQTLSKYERGLQALPRDVAGRLAVIIKARPCD